MNKQTIDLDVITGGVPQILHISQYDTGARTLEFNIYASNNSLDLTGATAKISGRKADGLGFEYPATITDGVVVADCTDQMTAVAGIVECAITLTNSEGQIQTARFDLNVKPAPLNDDTVISDSDFPLIEQAIEAEGKAEEYAEEAEAWAVGTRNGEPVPVSDPTYENNAKYWAEQAEQTDIGQVNEEIADIVNVYGSKNLIPYPYQRITSSNGITWTDNGDGTITADGTATGNSWVRFAGSTLTPVEIPTPIKQLIGKEVILSSGENVSGIGIRIDLYDASKTGVLSADTSSVEERKFTIPSNSVYMALQAFVFTGNTASNLKIKPMLRLASIEDDTYVPYVPTNAKLDEEKVSYDDANESVQKNLNSYPYNNTTKTQNGITFTDLGDGRIRANGTAIADAYFSCHLRTLGTNNGLIVPNGKYIFNGCPAGGNDIVGGTYAIRIERTYGGTATRLGTDIGNGAEITLNGDDYFTDKVQLQINIIIRNGATVNNIVFSPMLRKATVKDDTWAPYIPNNTELMSWKANGVLGAKNLIPYPYYDASGSTNRGITFTYDADGVITANGTSFEANLDSFFLVNRTSDLTLKAGSYIISGCPTNGGNTKYWIVVYKGTSEIVRDYGEGAMFTLNSDTAVAVQCQVYRNGYVANNLVFKPMLRLAEDTDDTYQPYAMTNRELTERVAEGLDTITFVNAQNTNNLTNLVKMGNLRILHIGCNLTSLTPDSATTWIHLITIPDGAKYQVRMVGYDSTQNIAVVLRAEGTEIFLSPLAQLSVNDFIVGTLIYEV